LVLSIVSLIQRWQFNSIQFNSIVSVWTLLQLQLVG
jgi:hypothetical protein